MPDTLATLAARIEAGLIYKPQGTDPWTSDDACAALAELVERAENAELRAARLRDYLHDEEGLWHRAIDDIENSVALSSPETE